ncbi:DUF2934 domain-containing protein [Bradyrhizobium sp. 153]|uniref:DUF2934 domain-containing protein n=1 Tax=Bradyrhizobium sp. 153 TaxID=2782627 RepID=UPI001FF98A71|nr:DUF2934 domain-containing protein [Bradyrhizobium sp. 153]
MISDQATVNRLATFAKEIKDKLDELQATTLREEIRRRAFEFWQEADRPEGRRSEFWLRAESEQPGGRTSCEDYCAAHELQEYGSERRAADNADASSIIRNTARPDELKPQAGFAADSWPTPPSPVPPRKPQNEAVHRREVRMAHAYEDNVRARAYKLWEEAGRPEARTEEFWYEAERQLKEELVKHELKNT